MLEPITLAIASALMSPAAAIVYCLPSEQPPDAMETVDEIIAKFQAAQNDFWAKRAKAESEEEKQKIDENDDRDRALIYDEMHDLATQNAGTEGAGKAAYWVLSHIGHIGAKEGQGDWALQMLLEDYLDSDVIADVTRTCMKMTSRYIAALEKIRTESSNERARALADFYRAGQLIMLSNAAQTIADPDGPNDPNASHYMVSIDDDLRKALSDPDEAEKLASQGEALYAHCQEAYAEVELYPDSGRMIGAKAERALFELRNLQIGDIAPNVTGEDAEGIEFNLYDYRGQVVVLDFWAFW